MPVMSATPFPRFLSCASKVTPGWCAQRSRRARFAGSQILEPERGPNRRFLHQSEDPETGAQIGPEGIQENRLQLWNAGIQVGPEQVLQAAGMGEFCAVVAEVVERKHLEDHHVRLQVQTERLQGEQLLVGAPVPDGKVDDLPGLAVPAEPVREQSRVRLFVLDVHPRRERISQVQQPPGPLRLDPVHLGGTETSGVEPGDAAVNRVQRPAEIGIEAIPGTGVGIVVGEPQSHLDDRQDHQRGSQAQQGLDHYALHWNRYSEPIPRSGFALQDHLGEDR